MSRMPCEFCSSASQPAYFVSLGSDSREVFRCDGCGAVQIDSPFPDEALHQFYERDYFSAKPWQIAKASVLATDYFGKVNRAAGPNPWRGRVLEIGAGFGFFAGLVQQQTGVRVDVVEPSRCCRDYIQEHALAGTIFSRIDDPTLPVGVYSEVFAFHVAEHLQRLGPFLRDVGRLLAPDGRLWILTPNASSRSFTQHNAQWGWAVPDQHYQFLSQYIPHSYFESLGFSVDACVDVRPAKIHFPSAWRSRLTNWTAWLTDRIAESGPRAGLAFRAIRKVTNKASHGLRQNVTTWNFCEVERFYCRVPWRRPHDELMLVLRKAPSRVAALAGG